MAKLKSETHTNVDVRPGKRLKQNFIQTFLLFANYSFIEIEKKSQRLLSKHISYTYDELYY